jgi:uncharacterized protein (DUF58 family)
MTKSAANNEAPSDDAQRGFTTIRPGAIERAPHGAPARTQGRVERWVRQLLNAPRKLKFTREGKFFVGITLGVGFAAVNTANNLLYLMLGLLLALIVVSGVMSEWSLQNLYVTRKLPLRAQVGRAHIVEIEVFNRKGRVPSYAIEVEDLRADQPADKRCFFLKISPNSAQVAAYRRTPTKRGRDLHTGFRIATRFPFGLFEKSRELHERGELIIYPSIEPVSLRDHATTSAGEEQLQPREGRSDDVLGLRRFREGDDIRDVHWRTSARTGSMVVRQRASEAQATIELALNVHKAVHASSNWDQLFEARIKELASRAVAHVKRGTRVVLRLSSGRIIIADRERGADGLLRALALVESELPVQAPTQARRATT